MLVKNWMKRDVSWLDVDDSMHAAIVLMKEQQMSMLPIMRQGNLVGVVTDRDLKRASASDATSLDVHELGYLLAKIKVAEIMTKNPITVPPDFTIEETAEILLKNKISSVPVVSAGAVVGIISQQDLFRAMLSLSGFEKRGVQFAFELEDRPGSIKEVTDIIRNHGGRLVSILSSRDRAPDGFRHVYVRAYDINRSTFRTLIDDLKKTATMLYMVDHKEGKREEFRVH